MHTCWLKLLKIPGIHVVILLLLWKLAAVESTGLIRTIASNKYIEDLDEGPDNIIAIYDHQAINGYTSHTVTQEFDCRLIGVSLNSVFLSVGRDSNNAVECRTVSSISSTSATLQVKSGFRTYFNTAGKQYFFTDDGLLHFLSSSLMVNYTIAKTNCPASSHSRLLRVDSDSLREKYKQVAGKSPENRIWIGAEGHNYYGSGNDWYKWYDEGSDDVNPVCSSNYCSKKGATRNFGLTLKDDGHWYWDDDDSNLHYYCSFKIFQDMTNWPWQ